MKILSRLLLFLIVLTWAGKIPDQDLDADDDEITEEDHFALDLKKPPVYDKIVIFLFSTFNLDLVSIMASYRRYRLFWYRSWAIRRFSLPL